MKTAEAVICGAGIAGVSAAYHLAVRHGLSRVVLIDERPPLSLTSDKSSECYRNWWPGPGNEMVALVNRSLDLLEDWADESGNIFRMNRRGYLYLTADPDGLPHFAAAAAEPAQLGAGPLRIHRGHSTDPPYQPAPAEGYGGLPSGADLFLDAGVIRRHFPYLPETIRGALHVRRAGWLSGQQLGMHLLTRGREAGVEVISACLAGLRTVGNRVESVRLSTGETIATRKFVNAAGPLAGQVGQMLNLALPIYNAVHHKAAIRDSQKALPRHAPLLIWSDPQKLAWRADEREWLDQDPGMRWLLETLPSGAHTRPEGGPESDIILLMWDYHNQPNRAPELPIFPPPLDDRFPEIALRGMAAMLPKFEAYIDHLPRPVLDGGYYTQTPENRPLIGPLPVEGAYILGALSGFGIMVAGAAGELLAAHLTESDLPSYSPAFLLERYQTPAYQRLLEAWGNSGQL